MSLRIIWLFILVAAAAIFQQVPWLQVAGVRPNWILLVLLLAVFMVKSWWEYLGLVAVAAALLQTQLLIPEINSWGAVAALAATVVAAYLLRQILPWQSFLNYLLLVVLASAGFYLLADRAFLLSRSPLFFQELLYNLIVAVLLYALVGRSYEKRTGVKL